MLPVKGSFRYFYDVLTFMNKIKNIYRFMPKRVMSSYSHPPVHIWQREFFDAGIYADLIKVGISFQISL